MLRNSGKFTMADQLAYRMKQRPVRTAAATSTVVVSIFYLLAQMVGAGSLVVLLLGIDKTNTLAISAVIAGVGALMIVYVTVGGMKGTTWVQIVKAVLLMVGSALIVVLVLAKFDFNLSELLGAAANNSGKEGFLEPGLKYGIDLTHKLDFLSLGLALVLGTAGLPHILVRFYTVPTSRDARKSVLWAIGLIGVFYLFTLVLGFGAAALLNTGVGSDVASSEGNLASPLLAEAVGGGAGSTGGAILLALISAVAFATILAVVAGLTLAGASAVSHDLYASVLKGGKANEKDELRVSKITTVALGVVAIVLGILFEKQNIAFMVGLAFSIAASCNFPVLLLSMYWKKLTTRGAMIGGWLGLITAVVLMILGPTIWVQILGHEKPIYPFEYPALFSMAVAFIGIWFFSITDKSAAADEERARFFPQFIRSQTGLGASGAVAH